MAAGLATRCSACGTVFRVVPDQLRVSEGWVRCGRCAEVFNAAEALLDLDTGAPRRLGDEAPPGPRRELADFSLNVPRAAEPAAAAAHPAPPQPAWDAEPEPRYQPKYEPEPEPQRAAAYAPPEHEHERHVHGHEAQRELDMPVVDDTASRFATDAAEPFDVSADPRPPPTVQPSFVRQAERAARWRRPRVRAALAAAAVLGLLGLALQVAFEYRDLVAARYPGLRPALEAGCELLACSVGPARIIEGLLVDSSGLVRVEKSNLYRLNVALKNRAALDVALPALELALTDAQGKLVARRVLRPAELGVNQATLSAGRELTLQATLQAATAPVAGYTIELFYP